MYQRDPRDITVAVCEPSVCRTQELGIALTGKLRAFFVLTCSHLTSVLSLTFLSGYDDTLQRVAFVNVVGKNLAVEGGPGAIFYLRADTRKSRQLYKQSRKWRSNRFLVECSSQCALATKREKCSQKLHCNQFGTIGRRPRLCFERGAA